MTMMEAAKSYRYHLASTLATAKLRLSPADYDCMAEGMRSEITRLDEEIDALRLAEFMGVTGQPVLPRIIEFATNTVMRVRSNAQTLVNIHNVEAVPDVDKFVVVASGQSTYEIPHTPSFVMNRALQVSRCAV